MLFDATSWKKLANIAYNKYGIRMEICFKTEDIYVGGVDGRRMSNLVLGYDSGPAEIEEAAREVIKAIREASRPSPEAA